MSSIVNKKFGDFSYTLYMLYLYVYYIYMCVYIMHICDRYRRKNLAHFNMDFGLCA